MTTPEERAHQVRQMITNSRLEGIEPSETDKELHQAYIAGTTTLTDLHNHAIAFTLEHVRDDGKAAEDHLAAGRPISYIDENLAPGALLRKWPDGRLEVIDLDKDGSVRVIRTLPTKLEMMKRRDAVRAAQATVELSGGKVSDEMLAKGGKYATGQITLDEFLNDLGLGHDPAQSS